IAVAGGRIGGRSWLEDASIGATSAPVAQFRAGTLRIATQAAKDRPKRPAQDVGRQSLRKMNSLARGEGESHRKNAHGVLRHGAFLTHGRAGGTRFLVACSKPKASSISRGSLHAVPVK